MNPDLLNFLHLAFLYVQTLYLKRDQVDCVLVCKHSGFGPNLAQFWSKQNIKCFLQNGFYPKLDASTGKLLSYDVFCTPKATVMHAFINTSFCQTGAKSRHQGSKLLTEGTFFWFGLHEK